MGSPDRAWTCRALWNGWVNSFDLKTSQLSKLTAAPESINAKTVKLFLVSYLHWYGKILMSNNLRSTHCVGVRRLIDLLVGLKGYEGDWHWSLCAVLGGLGLATDWLLLVDGWHSRCRAYVSDTYAIPYQLTWLVWAAWVQVLGYSWSLDLNPVDMMFWMPPHSSRLICRKSAWIQCCHSSPCATCLFA